MALRGAAATAVHAPCRAASSATTSPVQDSARREAGVLLATITLRIEIIGSFLTFRVLAAVGEMRRASSCHLTPERRLAAGFQPPRV